jgi:hypothetical protein
MLSMHEEEKEVVIYVTTEKINAQEDGGNSLPSEELQQAALL